MVIRGHFDLRIMFWEQLLLKILGRISVSEYSHSLSIWERFYSGALWVLRLSALFSESSLTIFAPTIFPSSSEQLWEQLKRPLVPRFLDFTFSWKKGMSSGLCWQSYDRNRPGPKLPAFKKILFFIADRVLLLDQPLYHVLDECSYWIKVLDWTSKIQYH